MRIEIPGLVDGHTLTYDSDDVVDTQFNEEREAIDITPEGATSVSRELGDASFHLHLKFKPGKSVTWVNENNG